MVLISVYLHSSVDLSFYLPVYAVKAWSFTFPAVRAISGYLEL